MLIRLAHARDIPGFLALAGQVEHWFGPMVNEPGFHANLDRNVARGSALVAVDGTELLGGLWFSVKPSVCHVRWLVIHERARGQGVGRALMEDAMRRFVRAPTTVEVVTFGADHPGAEASGARAFYASLGFVPAEAAPAGPEGGSRQVYRRKIT